MPTRYRLILRSHAEKMVIALIRSAVTEDLRANSAFAELARCAGRQGLSILAPGAPSLSIDEIAMLASLAACQRKSLAVHHVAVSDLDHALFACAAELAGRAIRLPFRAIQRVDFIRRQGSAGTALGLR